MKVKATRLGYYANIRIKEGQAFRLKDSKHFSEKWMVKLDKKAKVQELVIDEPIQEESVLIDDAEEELVEANSNQEVI